MPECACEVPATASFLGAVKAKYRFPVSTVPPHPFALPRTDNKAVVFRFLAHHPVNFTADKEEGSQQRHAYANISVLTNHVLWWQLMTRAHHRGQKSARLSLSLVSLRRELH